MLTSTSQELHQPIRDQSRVHVSAAISDSAPMMRTCRQGDIHIVIPHAFTTMVLVMQEIVSFFVGAFVEQKILRYQIAPTILRLLQSLLTLLKSVSIVEQRQIYGVMSVWNSSAQTISTELITHV